MNQIKRYEILDYLPAYGDMYISISDNNESFYSEGFVVRFYKSNGKSWIANFKLGGTHLKAVFDFPEHNKIIVIAGGLGYIMNPESEKPVSFFGYAIDDILQTENKSLVCADGISFLIIDNTTGEIWRSERISWDGFRNLKYNNNIISGQSYDPTNSNQSWSDFTFNILTKEVIGGSYTESIKNNPHIPKVTLQSENIKKPWWKIWE